MSDAELASLLEVAAAVICALACAGIALELVGIWIDRKNLNGERNDQG